MDLYTFALVLGATGLGVMGVAGVAQHAGAGGAHAAHGAHAGVPAQGLHGGHGLHAGHGHAPGLRARLHAPVPPHAAHQHGLHLPDALAWLVSPRVLFGTLLGLGMTDSEEGATGRGDGGERLR